MHIPLNDLKGKIEGGIIRKLVAGGGAALQKPGQYFPVMPHALIRALRCD